MEPNNPQDDNYKPHVKEEFEDDDEYMIDDELDFKERQEEEDFDRACSCTCGAWVVGKDGRGYHVADCYCGAE